MSAARSALSYQRYELKYHIPLDLVDEISEYLAPYCELDHFSKIAEDQYYVINSLYFDSPNFLFLGRKQADMAQRYSLRARSYGLNPKPPYFLEIKEKANEFVNKKRVKINFENWQELFWDTDLNKHLDKQSSNYFDEFLHHYTAHTAEPKILTRYRRKAFFSTIDEYVRITFDRDLQFQYENEFNIIPDVNRTYNYDNNDSFGNSGGNVVLEIKSLTQVPHWVLDMISHFGLTRSSFSKYENSIITSNLEELNDSETFDRVPALIY